MRHLPGWDVLAVAPVGIAVVSLDGRYQAVNPAFCQLVGREEDALLGQWYLDPVHPDDRAANRDEGLRVLAGEGTGYEIDERLVRPDGEVRWAHSVIALERGPDGRPRQFVAVAADVTGSVRAKADLAAAERQARQLAELSPDGVVVVEDGRFVYANPAAAALLGLDDPAELVGVESSTIRSAASHAVARQRWAKVRDGATVTGSPETLRHRDGHDVPVAISSGPISFEGRPAVLSVVRDISAQVARAAELDQARLRLRLSFDHAATGQAVIGPDGVFREVNPALCAMLGYDSDELLATRWADLTHPDDVAADQAGAVRLEAGLTDAYATEKRYRHRDGRTVWAAIHVTTVPDGDGGRYFLAQIEDVTERRYREEERRLVAEELATGNERLSAAIAVAQVNEARYRALVDHLPDTVAYVYDRDRRITVASGASIAERGFEASALLGRRVGEILEPADAELVEGYLERAFAGEATTAEVRLATSGIDNLVDVVPLVTDGAAPQEVLLVARDIRAIKARERELARAERRWRAAFDLAPVGIAEVELDGRVRRANPALSALTGVAEDDLTGFRLSDLVHPDEREAVAARAAALLAGAAPRSGVVQRIVRPDGEVRWVDIRGSSVDGPAGADHLLVQMADVTEERHRRAALDAVHARFSALVEHGTDVITILDGAGRVLYASPASRLVLGVEPDDLIGVSLLASLHPDDVRRARRVGRSLLVDGGVVTVELRVAHAAGGWRTLEVTAANRLDDPAVAGIVCNGRDVTERAEAAARLAHQAMHDTLTDLPNRALLLDRLDHALARSARSGRPCALLFLDLDRFKTVNDTLGHAAGDRLLVVVAQRLRASVRPGDSIARLGGDEFVVLAEPVDGADSARQLADRIRTAIGRPVDLGDRTVTVGCSVGIALSDRHRPEALLQEADTALYRAKARGRNRWEIYDGSMRTLAGARLDTEQLIREALAGGRVVVHHQPIVDLATGAVAATEALARLLDADGRLVGPEQFVPVAEDAGLIVALGEAVLDLACAQHARRRSAGTGLGRVAVNLSAAQLSSPDLVDLVQATLTRHGLGADQLCLELTETSLIDAGSSMRKSVGALRDLGATIALDDFGTGWSSLATLRRFPIDVIKIDRSFVAGLGTDPGDTEVVRAVVGLGHALGLLTVAEGVETAEQDRLLRRLGCDLGQGYLYGRPAADGDHAAPAPAVAAPAVAAPAVAAPAPAAPAVAAPAAPAVAAPAAAAG